ncbi:unnamed protein product [Aphanomyces euteiches]
MLPLDYISGLADVQLADVIVPGEESESDDAFSQRILTHARFPSASGNKSDYYNWSLEVPGVGGAQVVPLAYGPGTVGITIVDSDAKPASAQLVSDVQNYISPVTGDGKAPILSGVTVVSAIGVTVNVTAATVLVSGYTLSQVKAAFETAVVAYLKSIAFAADPTVNGGVYECTHGIPENLADIQNALRDLIPAHLDISYEFNYFIWNELDELGKTWDQTDALGLTWEQWDIYS